MAANEVSWVRARLAESGMTIFRRTIQHSGTFEIGRVETAYSRSRHWRARLSLSLLLYIVSRLYAAILRQIRLSDRRDALLLGRARRNTEMEE
jgi:hypothetical protein